MIFHLSIKLRKLREVKLFSKLLHAKRPKTKVSIPTCWLQKGLSYSPPGSWVKIEQSFEIWPYEAAIGQRWAPLLNQNLTFVPIFFSEPFCFNMGNHNEVPDVYKGAHFFEHLSFPISIWTPKSTSNFRSQILYKSSQLTINKPYSF